MEKEEGVEEEAEEEEVEDVWRHPAGTEEAYLWDTVYHISTIHLYNSTQRGHNATVSSALQIDNIQLHHLHVNYSTSYSSPHD